MSGDRWVGTSTPYLRPAGDTWKQEAAASGRVGTQRITFAGEATPPAEVATTLGVALGEPVIQRRRLILLDDVPVEIADSYWTKEIAADTELSRAARIPGGAVAALAGLGKRPVRVDELVGARPAAAHERDLLGIPESEWVLSLTRSISDEGSHPYEVTVMVSAASCRQLNYSMKVGNDE